jgi:hypothetical protein
MEKSWIRVHGCNEEKEKRIQKLKYMGSMASVRELSWLSVGVYGELGFLQ